MSTTQSNDETKVKYATTSTYSINEFLENDLSEELKNEMEYLFGKIPDIPKDAVIDPLEDLPEDKRQKIKKFQEACEKWPTNLKTKDENNEEKEWIGTSALEQLKKDQYEYDLSGYRFLRGYHWEQTKEGLESMKKTIEWRAREVPERMSLKEVQNIQQHGLVFHYGFDKEFHPIVYVIMSQNKEKDTEKNQILKLKAFIYMMQRAMFRAYPTVFELTWIVDVENASFSMSSIKALKDVFMSLGDYYCERLTRVLILNPSWTINLIYKFLKPFLPAHVAEKYKLIKGDMKKTCLQYVDEDQLLERFGGKVKYTFDYDRLLKFEQDFQKEMDSKNIQIITK